MFDGLETSHSVVAEIAAPDGGQHYHRRHRDAADPDHDAEDVQGAGESDVIHDMRLPGVAMRGAWPLGHRMEITPRVFVPGCASTKHSGYFSETARIAA
jgi:hypothetical protein